MHSQVFSGRHRQTSPNPRGFIDVIQSIELTLRRSMSVRTAKRVVGFQEFLDKRNFEIVWNNGSLVTVTLSLSANALNERRESSQSCLDGAFRHIIHPRKATHEFSVLENHGRKQSGASAARDRVYHLNENKLSPNCSQHRISQQVVMERVLQGDKSGDEYTHFLQSFSRSAILDRLSQACYIIRFKFPGNFVGLLRGGFLEALRHTERESFNLGSR